MLTSRLVMFPELLVARTKFFIFGVYFTKATLSEVVLIS